MTLLHIDMDICIPWRSDHGWRAQVFDWVLPAWQRTGLSVFVGIDDDDGPINVSRALNRARAQASGPVMVVASADHVPNVQAVVDASAVAMEHGWCPLFSSTAGVSRDATLSLVLGDTTINPAEHMTAQVPFCTALVAVRTDVWDEIGGWDERFHGWGCEDTAFRMVLDTLYPEPPTIAPHTTYALWHEAASRERFDANVLLLNDYIACGGNPDAMRTMLAGRML